MQSFTEQYLEDVLEEAINKIQLLEDKIETNHALYHNGYSSGIFDSIEILNHLKQRKG